MNFQGIKTILKALGQNFLNFSERGFVYGPQGRLFRRNMEYLWFDHCVTMPPYNVFLTTSDKVTETLETLKESSLDSRPFGLAAIEDSKTIWNENLYPSDRKASSHKVGRVAIVVDKENAKDMFHRKQRERKVWWRKFARHPSRFALTEAKKISNNRETIDIVAQFDFGNVVLESIVHRQDAKKIYERIGEEKERPSASLHTIEHVASLDWGCLTMLCDGFEITGDTAELKIHPKLSPYKVAFYLEPNEEEDRKSQEKSRLILYLNNLLKGKGLESVLARSIHGIETFHVPLTVTVDNASLQNGIVTVTSQFTTIAEAVHVTDLAKYVAARCT